MLKVTNINALMSFLKDLGYENVEKDSNQRVIVYVEKVGNNDTRKQELQAIAKALQGTYLPQKNGSGWKSSVGATKVKNFIILAKPSAEGKKSSLSSLDARVFSTLGTTDTFDYKGEKVSVKVFDSSKKIEDSIIEGCKTSSLLGKDVAEVFKDFFSSGKIGWGNIKPAVISKLGVYIGEVLVGWVFLKSLERKHFTSNPFKGTPKKFAIPDDPSFSGVDSFIIMANKNYYCLSSKLDAGAAASLFSNLLSKGLEVSHKLSKSVFKELCEITKKNDLKTKDARSIVYNYGIRKILKIDEKQIKDVNDVYNQVFTRKLGREAKLVIANIKNYKNVDDVVLKNISQGDSISSFFNREIAKLLNNDKESIKQMKEILSGKDYWQGNLNSREWIKGNLQYRWLNSADAELEIIGTKGSASDITSKQGWINYRLEYK